MTIDPLTTPDRPILHASPTLVLVHGAWHGPWCWAELVPALEAHGLTTATVDLPSSGPDVAALGDLDADAAAVTAVLDAVAGPKIILGHSYGGLPVSQAAAGRTDVVHLVYLCAFLTDAGLSVLDAVGGEPVPWWRMSEDGTWGMPDIPEKLFYSDCTAATAAAAAARLQPQSMSSLRQPLRATGWIEVPATYVVTDRDPGLPVVAQEAMAAGRAGRVVHIDTGHSPFLSRPGELATLLAQCVDGLAADVPAGRDTLLPEFHAAP